MPDLERPASTLEVGEVTVHIGHERRTRRFEKLRDGVLVGKKLEQAGIGVVGELKGQRVVGRTDVEYSVGLVNLVENDGHSVARMHVGLEATYAVHIVESIRVLQLAVGVVRLDEKSPQLAVGRRADSIYISGEGCIGIARFEIMLAGRFKYLTERTAIV